MHDAALERSWRQDAHAAAWVGVAHMTSHFFQMLLAPIYPWLMRDFGIGFAQAGFLATIFFVISSTGQALAGFAVDRVGAVRILLVGLGLLVGAGVSLALTQSYAGLCVTAAFAGAGNAMFHPADFTILNRQVSPGRLGHAFAMHGLSGNLGWAAGATFMAGVTALAGWHVAGMLAAAIGAFVLALIHVRRHALEESPITHPSPGGDARDRHGAGFAFLRSATVWWCFAFFFISTGAGGILQNFAPSMLSHVYGVSLAVGAGCLTAYLLGSACGTVLGGFVAGRERRSERVIAVALSVSAACSLFLATGATPVIALIPLLLVLGAGAGTASPSRDLLVRRAATTRFGAGAFGRVYGIVYSGLDSGLALGPLIAGHLLDEGLFRGGLLTVGILQVSALLVALRIGREG